MCENAHIKNDLRVTALCHNLIGLCRHSWTPLTMGLGLSIHHDFGSKQLIEELHSLGYSISYDEVRRFLTSVAVAQQNQEVYVPTGLESSAQLHKPAPAEEVDTSDSREQEERGSPEPLFDAAIDNFDQNEETLDGKSTTHAMAAVIYKRSIPPPTQGVPRLEAKSMSAADALHTQLDQIRR